LTDFFGEEPAADAVLLMITMVMMMMFVMGRFDTSRAHLSADRLA
jgi:hypothetical protein